MRSEDEISRGFFYMIEKKTTKIAVRKELARRVIGHVVGSEGIQTRAEDTEISELCNER